MGVHVFRTTNLLKRQKGFVGHSRHQKGICQLFNRNADAIRFIAPKSKFYPDGNLWKLLREDLPEELFQAVLMD